MGLEAQKLELIERLMKVKKEAVLNKYEQLLMEAQLLTRAEESMVDIEKGKTVSLNDFGKSNKEWIKLRNTK